MTTAKQQGPRMVVGIVVVVQCTHCMHAAIAQPIALPERELCVCVCVCVFVCASLTCTVLYPRKQFLDVRLHTCSRMGTRQEGGGEACNHGHIREQA